MSFKEKVLQLLLPKSTKDTLANTSKPGRVDLTVVEGVTHLKVNGDFVISATGNIALHVPDGKVVHVAPEIDVTNLKKGDLDAYTDTCLSVPSETKEVECKGCGGCSCGK